MLLYAFYLALFVCAFVLTDGKPSLEHNTLVLRFASISADPVPDCDGDHWGRRNPCDYVLEFEVKKCDGSGESLLNYGYRTDDDMDHFVAPKLTASGWPAENWDSDLPGAFRVLKPTDVPEKTDAGCALKLRIHVYDRDDGGWSDRDHLGTYEADIPANRLAKPAKDTLEKAVFNGFTVQYQLFIHTEQVKSPEML